MSSKEEVKMYYVKSDYRGLYDNKFIGNKASLPYWDGCGVDRGHIAGLEATVKESLQVQSNSAKDKAEELVDAYMNLRPIKFSDYSKIEYPFAKQCALMAADFALMFLGNYKRSELKDESPSLALVYLKEEIITL